MHPNYTNDEADMGDKQVRWRIRPFRPADQTAAKALIQAGLAEHFGYLDPTCNPDLDDIAAAYPAPGGAFFVVEAVGEIIGTGALQAETAVDPASPARPPCGRIVRVSVAPAYRRQGVGRAVTDHLIAAARRRRYRWLLVETNDDWRGAIRLYREAGFQSYAHRNGEIHMALPL